MDDAVIIAPILVPLTVAFLLPFVGLVARWLRVWVCIAAMVITLGALATLVRPVFLEGRVLVYWLSGWQPVEGLPIGIGITIDAWALLIAGVIAFVGLLALLHSVRYMAETSGRGAYYVLVMLLIASMIGFVITGDLFNQFIWLEVLSIAAFALTAFYYEERPGAEAAFKYLITNSLAALFILVALALLYMQTGALNLAHIALEFEATTAGVVAVGLLIGGYATKAALVPWHFWLPDAYTVAPAPIGGLFSGALSKVGIYGIGRTLFTLAPIAADDLDFIQGLLFAIAAMTMLVGGVQMLTQQSIKRILAFSSVSQMGYIVMGLALATPLALAAAGVHVVHHALVKAALFFAAGTVEERSGVRTLAQGGGLARRMPITFVFMLLAALSLSGMPFFSGFISKTMLEEAATAGGAAWMAGVAIVSSALTFAGMARLLWVVFFGSPDAAASADLQVEPVPPLALLAILLPVLLSLAIGLLPQWPVQQIAWPAAAALEQPQAYLDNVLKGQGDPVLPAHVEPAPSPLALDHMLVPLVVAAAGSLLAYASMPVRERRWRRVRPVFLIVRALKRWHSGLISDYALWNAFSTAVVLILFVLINF